MREELHARECATLSNGPTVSNCMMANDVAVDTIIQEQQWPKINIIGLGQFCFRMTVFFFIHLLFLNIPPPCMLLFMCAAAVLVPAAVAHPPWWPEVGAYRDVIIFIIIWYYNLYEVHDVYEHNSLLWIEDGGTWTRNMLYFGKYCVSSALFSFRIYSIARRKAINYIDGKCIFPHFCCCWDRRMSSFSTSPFTAVPTKQMMMAQLQVLPPLMIKFHREDLGKWFDFAIQPLAAEGVREREKNRNQPNPNE